MKILGSQRLSFEVLFATNWNVYTLVYIYFLVRGICMLCENFGDFSVSSRGLATAFFHVITLWIGRTTCDLTKEDFLSFELWRFSIMKLCKVACYKVSWLGSEMPFSGYVALLPHNFEFSLFLWCSISSDHCSIQFACPPCEAVQEMLHLYQEGWLIIFLHLPSTSSASDFNAGAKQSTQCSVYRHTLVCCVIAIGSTLHWLSNQGGLNNMLVVHLFLLPCKTEKRKQLKAIIACMFTSKGTSSVY